MFIAVWRCYRLCSYWFTVYPKKYAHGFVVLCFVVVMQSFVMNSHEVFIHIHQGSFAGTGAIVRLPQCQWSKPDGYGKISQCITTTKHSKAKTVCIFLGIYWTCNRSIFGVILWKEIRYVFNVVHIYLIKLDALFTVIAFQNSSVSFCERSKIDWVYFTERRLTTLAYTPWCCNDYYVCIWGCYLVNIALVILLTSRTDGHSLITQWHIGTEYESETGLHILYTDNSVYSIAQTP